LNRTKKLRSTLAERKVTGKEYQERLREQHAKMSSANLSWANLDAIEQRKKKNERMKQKDIDSDEDAENASDKEEDDMDDVAKSAREMLDGSYDHRSYYDP
jgi:hypothetical protein